MGRSEKVESRAQSPEQISETAENQQQGEQRTQRKREHAFIAQGRILGVQGHTGIGRCCGRRGHGYGSARDWWIGLSGKKIRRETKEPKISEIKQTKT